MDVFLNTNCTNCTNLFGTRMDTDEHGFTVRMVFLNTNRTNFTIFWHTEGHGFTVRRITLFILPQIDTDGHGSFLQTIGYHKDTQEADKLVLPALGGARGGR